ncbi:MAG: stage III sporulation protein AE [Patescibacteria group bacterium]
MPASRFLPVLLISISSLAFQARPQAAAPVDRVVEAELSALDTGDLQRFLGSVDAEIRPYLPDFRPAEAGGKTFSPGGLARNLLLRLARELALNAHLLGKLVLLAVLCALLAHLGNSFAPEGTNRLAFYVCYLVMMGLAANSFLATLGLSRDAIGDLVGFMYALIPVVCSLLASVGAAATAALFNPLIVGGVAAIGHLVLDFVLPLASLTAVVTLVSHLAEGFSLSRLAGLLRDLTVAAAGVILAGFVGLVTVRGVAAAAADGVALRTAKYVSGTFVPVVGKGLSDAMETVAGCSLLLKNTVGGFGAWTVLVLTAFPLVKILALAAIYRLAAALVQPLGDSRLADALQAIGGGFILLFAVTALVGLAFLLGLTILVALGNFTYALR